MNESKILGALADRRIYGFELGKGPDYPVGDYKTSIFGLYQPDS